MGKVRRVDLNADEFLVGILGMTAAEAGVYLACNLLMYSSGGAIPYDDERLMSLLNDRPSVLKRLVARLVAGGKLSATGTQVFKKRTLSEIELASKRMSTARENGAKGGRTRTTIEENQEVKKPRAFSGEKLSLSLSQPLSLIKESTPLAPARSDDGFKEFYRAYPRHVARRAAEKAYRAALKRGAMPAALLAAAGRYAAACAGKDPEYVKHPATWLNGECYLDGTANDGAAAQVPTQITNIDDRIKWLLEHRGEHETPN